MTAWRHPASAEIRAAVAASAVLAIACLLTFLLTTNLLARIYSVSSDDDLLEERPEQLGPTARRPGGHLAALDDRADTTAVSARSSALRCTHLDAARYGRSCPGPSYAACGR
ncbi:hypothetical protein GCM10009609_31580 [Pseudonocardia aurantiaca]